jgi:hypothetical protein
MPTTVAAIKLTCKQEKEFRKILAWMPSSHEFRKVSPPPLARNQ